MTVDHPLAAAALDEHERPVEVTVEGPVVVITLRGCLDDSAGTDLLAAATTAVSDEAQRLDVDLRSVTAFTVDGAAALVRCREVASALQEGLHYRTGRGPGREALLAAYARPG